MNGKIDAFHIWHHHVGYQTAILVRSSHVQLHSAALGNGLRCVSPYS